VLLDESTDCRIGLSLADEYQNKGVGSILFPAIVDIARKFGRKRMILWGGVFRDNQRAIRFYEKHGFRLIGEFAGQDDRQSLDMLLEF
jgi:GNAT superfamily N-acetyltransferase